MTDAAMDGSARAGSEPAGGTSDHRGPATIDADAYLAVLDEVFDGMLAVLASLDDDTVNRTPVPGVVNTAFALVTHMHGMAAYWCGSVIAGERIPRDRDAEFRAEGTAAEAVVRVEDLRTRMPGWVETAASAGVLDPHATGTSRTDATAVSAAWILQHVLHELAQHLGQMEICRDIVTGAQSPAADD